MMQPSAVLWALITLLVLHGSHAAVTWTTIGCDEVTFDGYTVDDLWDNALLMAQNAVDEINVALDASIISALTSQSRAANNAKWMFGIDYKFASSLPSAAKSTLQEVSSVYTNVNTLLRSDEGLFICNGNGLVYGTFGDLYESGVWYYSLPGTSDAVILTYTAGVGEKARPCSDPELGGQTFNGGYYTNEILTEEKVRGVLLCTQNYNSSYKGVLTQGYSVDSPMPNPDNYKSVSGTILHEMVHVIDTSIYLDQTSSTIPPEFKGKAYGFARCATLAKSDPDDALINPDNYRVFAEMSMSPGTRWAGQKPATSSRRKKRHSDELME